MTKIVKTGVITETFKSDSEAQHLIVWGQTSDGDLYFYTSSCYDYCGALEVARSLYDTEFTNGNWVKGSLG